MEPAAVVRPLLAWYDTAKRVLPWRSQPTPYRVWISEIMLQQTRVEAVKPYYDRFLAALPDAAALAAADEGKLFKLWEGLGYYNRARNLQRAARILVRDYGGSLPADYAALKALPGIGSYTAGAIASIAYGIPVPAVDGNVLRVLARLTASEADVLSPAVRREAERTVSSILPAKRAGDFNQALMELGATVCLPNGAPRCDDCPLASLCDGYRLDVAAHLPVKAAKKPRRVEKRTVFVLNCDSRVALRARPEKGLLAGLYELPAEDGALSAPEAKELLRAWGGEPASLTRLPDAKHVFSHLEWHMTGYAARLASPLPRFVWATAEELDAIYSLPSAFAAYRGAMTDGCKKQRR